MESEEYLQSSDLKKQIKKTHLAITEKFPNIETGFDSWYTNKIQVVGQIENLGQDIARKLKDNFGLAWSKRMPDGSVFDDFEKSPDGELLGLSILLVGWVASQFSAKLRDHPNEKAQSLLDNYPSIVDAAIKIGLENGKTESIRILSKH